MLESQFYARIILIAIFGIVFILSMLKKGKKNSIENPPEKHIALKIISGVFLLLSLLSLAAGIMTITQIQFPTEMGKQPITPHSIIRSTSDIQIWGYPTSLQNMALSHITSVFASLAFAAYFAVFRKSGSNWWQKLLKVVGIILMWMFFVSATDLHYFDIFELYAPIGFLILAIFGLSGEKKVAADRVDEEIAVPTIARQNNDADSFVASEESSSHEDKTTIETIDVEL